MGNTACAPHNYSHALTDVPSWSLLVSVVFIVVFCAVAWFASPKGENQTVWRSTLVLSAWACWLMWGLGSVCRKGWTGDETLGKLERGAVKGVVGTRYKTEG
ncbi:H(+)-transporting V0 sector ATPase subunit e [Friedmanniomyces endolithicus]|nr:H(+)-transporting V0 sector ATPase subunit e [Friedmanniomyces endolithicus]KAK0873086.1 H(+)-transporting V0 sector ATPase subunit e [Friedmanniomyces endolithicus]KAK1037434.1 H(+)-transporting V0 sector ATPase subunit e [Friedmanniomyces endolithicus]